MTDMYNRYFMFSQEHMRYLKELEAKQGNKNYRPSTVLVGGSYKPYTNMVTDPKVYTDRYSDARIVASGDIRKMKFTEGD